MAQGPISPGRARLYIVIAAVLWSLSGSLAKLIALPGPTMACYRALFAGLALLPLLRRGDITLRPAMLGMVACFATMNVSFVTALTITRAANAIFLQYTAPAWMFLASIVWLREPLDRRSLVSVLAAMCGVLVIVLSGAPAEWLGIALALVAGAAYGGVAVFLRLLRSESPVWLTVLNHLASGLLLVPLLLVHSDWGGTLRVAPDRLAALAVFGVVQMAIPYVFFSRGLAVITPQEAGLIALLEPVLNPAWTYLAVGETPGWATLFGGAIILTAIAWRYTLRSAG